MRIERVVLLVAVLLASATGVFAQSGMRYPYVNKSDDAGPVIVSRDKQGGVKTAAMGGGGADGKVAAGFQIGFEDASTGAQVSWDDAQSACDVAEGWRLPSKGELQLIWLMGGAQMEQYVNSSVEHVAGGAPLHGIGGDFKALSPEGYWAVGRGVSQWSVSLADGSTASAIGSNLRVRCVRDFASSYDKSIGYTEGNANSRVLIADGDAKNGETVEWSVAVSEYTCPYPYHVPNKNELELVWVYKGGYIDNGFAASDYWTSTINPTTESKPGWSVSMNNGFTYFNISSLNYPIRCVRTNNNAVGNIYPYVSDDNSQDGYDGPIIISREGMYGVTLDGLIPVTGTDNDVVAKFQVANEDIGGIYTWSDAKTLCNNRDIPAGSQGDWRLPTLRELQLVWLMGGAPNARYELYENHLAGDSPMNDKSIFSSFNTLLLTQYRSSTTHRNAGYYWFVHMNDGTAGIETKDISVRCVRTIVDGQ